MFRDGDVKLKLLRNMNKLSPSSDCKLSPTQGGREGGRNIFDMCDNVCCQQIISKCPKSVNSCITKSFVVRYEVSDSSETFYCWAEETIKTCTSKFCVDQLLHQNQNAVNRSSICINVFMCFCVRQFFFIFFFAQIFFIFPSSIKFVHVFVEVFQPALFPYSFMTATDISETILSETILFIFKSRGVGIAFNVQTIGDNSSSFTVLI